MFSPILKDASTTVKLVFAALVVVGIWLASQLLAVLSGMLIFSVGLEEAMELLRDLESKRSINFLKYVQGITSIGLFIVSSFIIAVFTSAAPLDFLYLKKFPGRFSIILIVLLMIIVLPFSNLITEINMRLSLPESMSGIQQYIEYQEEQMERIMKIFLDAHNFWTLMANLIVIALIPAIGEEMLFRGVFQKFFIALSRNVHLGIFISAFLFSALHLQFLTFLPRFMLGVVFGYLVVWSGSLWPAIIGHFVNNFMAVIYYFFFYTGRTKLDLEHIGSSGNYLFLGIISFCVTSVLLWAIYKSFAEKRVLHEPNSGLLE
jgi:uncharacterized protein